MEKKSLLILVVAAIIGLGVTACGEPPGDNYEYREVSTNGQLTISGLSAYNGWEISAYAQHLIDPDAYVYVNLTAAGRAGNTYESGNFVGMFSEPVKVTSSGEAVLKVYQMDDDGYCVNYDGNHQSVTFNVNLSSPDYSDYVSGKITVSFNNGAGGTSFQIQDEREVSTNGQLTITGLGAYNGWVMSANAYNNNLEAYERVMQTTYGGAGSGEYQTFDANVSSGQAVTKVYTASNYTYSGYSGSDQNVEFSVSLWRVNSDQQARGRVIVTFANGIAAGEFQLYREQPVNTTGRLTITGLNSYNGRWLNISETLLSENDYSLKVFNSVTQIVYGNEPDSSSGEYYDGNITGGSIVLKVYKAEYDPDRNGGDSYGYHYSSYTGNDQDLSLEVRIDSTSGGDSTYGRVIVSFTGGIATGAFEPQIKSEVQTAGRLTVTGLSAYAGDWAISVNDAFFSNNDRLTAYEKLYKVYYESDDDDDYTYDYQYQHLPVTGNSVTFKVYFIEYMQWGVHSSYTGNDNDVVFNAYVNGDEVIYGTITVNFTNGIGSGAFVPNSD